MGRGFVQPVDDLGGKVEPSHPELLDALAAHLKETKFDVKNFIRAPRSERRLPDLGDRRIEGRAAPMVRAGPGPALCRRRSCRASFKVATAFPADGFKGGGEPTDYVLRYFGEPTDGMVHFQGSLSEHLFLNNARTSASSPSSGRGTWPKRS